MKLTKLLIAGIIGTTGLVSTCNYLIDRINPPEWYNTRWNELSEFVGREREQPRYFRVNLSKFPCNFFTETCVGLYTNNKIFLAKPYVNEPLVVDHEMFHALGFNEEQTDSLMIAYEIAHDHIR